MTECVLGGIVVALIAFAWRQAHAMQAMSGRSAKSSDRQLLMFQHMLERAYERKDLPGMQTASLHAQERIEQERIIANADNAAIGAVADEDDEDDVAPPTVAPKPEDVIYT